jgi:anti-sigma regulatory factor (Ser/Thr protein kinase)
MASPAADRREQIIEARLTMPAQAAYALTARLFVASSARILGVDEGSVEDLKLAISELHAAAVAAEPGASIEIRVTGGGEGPVVEFEGVTTLKSARSPSDETEEFASAYRLPLLQSIFPHMQIAGALVTIDIPDH